MERKTGKEKNPMEEKKDFYNIVLARHNKNDIARAFLLPDGEHVETMDKLLCDTARGTDQVVTAVAENIVVPDEDLDEYLAWQGTDRKHLKPITGRVSQKKWEDPDEDNEWHVHIVVGDTEDLSKVLEMIERGEAGEEPEPEKPRPVTSEKKDKNQELKCNCAADDDNEDDPTKHTVRGMLALLIEGAEAVTALAKSFRDKVKFDNNDGSLLEALTIVNESMFKTSALMFGVNLLGSTGDSGDDKE